VIGEEDIMIVHFCTDQPPSPVLDPVFDKPVTLCLLQGNKIVVPTPAGYDFVFDQYGYYRDSLVITSAGTYTIRVADANGCLSKPSAPIQVITASPPNKSTIRVRTGLNYEYRPDVYRCDNGKTLFDVYNANTSVWHEWSNGYTGDQLITEELGEFWVVAVNSSGCKSDTSEIVTVHPLNTPTPEPPDIIAPDGFNACTNLDEIVLQAEPGYVHYQWITSAGIFSNPVQSIQSGRLVTLRGSNAQGCWSDFNSAQVRFYNINPVLPSINVLLNYLSPNISGEAYEWFLNGNPIPDSNLQTWRALVPGDYQVRVFDGICWGKISFKKTIQ
jgi:hypothetical protein